MKNALVARILNRVADFLELKEETFRAKAYRRAAHTIQLLPTDIEEYAKKRKLTELPGIGKNIAEKIEEILETGQLSYLEELEKEYPIDMDSLLAIEGIGPRTIKILYEKLKIKNLQDLEYHAQKGNLQKIKGIGEKKGKKDTPEHQIRPLNPGKETPSLCGAHSRIYKIQDRGASKNRKSKNSRVHKKG